MWFIQRKSDGKTIWLLNKEYTIGRRNCTIELSDDLSVSRQHLKLSVDYSPLIQNTGPPILQIMDLGSTYGIIINFSATNTGKIESKVWVTLDIDSTFQFGVKNDWTVQWRNISVVCSALGSVERKRLHRKLTMLGAKLLSDWQDDITHLVTDKILLTQKVLDSLLAVKPIVMVDFFEKWMEILEQDPCGSMPDVSQFTPLIGPALEQFDKKCFLPKEERKSLFLGKTFIFATSNELTSSVAIAATKAGGNISNNVENFDVNSSLLMECSSPASDYSHLLTNVSSRGERPIPQNEIALAILSCSVEVHCNPRARNLIQNSQSHNNKQALASAQGSLRDQKTQVGNVSQLVCRKKGCEEPPSKRNRMEQQISEISSVLQPPTKKIHLDEMVADTPEIQHCDDDEENENALKRKQVRTRMQAFSEPLYSGRTNFDTKTHGNETMDKSRQPVSHSEFAGEHPSSILFQSIDSSSYIRKDKTLHVDELNVGYANNQYHEATLDQSLQTSSELLSQSTSTCQLKSLDFKRKSLNHTVGNNLNRSQWYGSDSPGRLNASKLIVKSNLVRPELVDKRVISQKLPSQLKVITRIKSMKITCLKEGKWTTKN